MINWNVDPILIDLGFIAPRWYGVMFAGSFIVGYYVLRSMFRREKRPIVDLDALTIYMMIATVIGARAGHMLFYEASFLFSNPLEFFAIWKGGLASHGATLGIMVGLWLFARKRPSYSYTWLLDRLAVATAIGGMFIRIGNLFNSEIIGRPTDVPWAFWFQRIDALPVYRHPTQLYEALLCLVVFAVLWIMYRRGVALRAGGTLIGTFFVLLFSGRFMIEFLKERQVDFESTMALDMGQLLSIPFIALGVWFLIRSRKASVKA